MTIRFLILSDTHDSAFPDAELLPVVDVVIHCGDLTMISGLSNFRKAFEALSICPAELKLVIPGNHDVSLDPAWWSKNLDEDDYPTEPERARELADSFATKGVRLLEEGTHRISLQDGRSFTLYASPYTPDFNGYVFAYTGEEDIFNTVAHTIPPDADVVVTHGPPLVPATISTRFGAQRQALWLFKAMDRHSANTAPHTLFWAYSRRLRFSSYTMGGTR